MATRNRPDDPDRSFSCSRYEIERLMRGPVPADRGGHLGPQKTIIFRGLLKEYKI